MNEELPGQMPNNARIPSLELMQLMAQIALVANRPAIPAPTPDPEATVSLPPFMDMCVMYFMLLGKQHVNKFNGEQASLYIGLIFEELGETIAELYDVGIDLQRKANLAGFVNDLERMAEAFKERTYLGEIMRADHAKLLDGAVDLAWVSQGLAYSISNDANAAFAEVARSNLSKFDGGIKHSEDGKIMKGDKYSPPHLWPFITQLDRDR